MRKLVGLLSVVLLAVGLAGCGKSGSGGSVSGTGTSDTAAPGAPPLTLPGTTTNKGTEDLSTKGSKADLSLEIDDFYFKPTFVKAAAGQTISVSLHNEGAATHTFTTGGGVDEELAKGAKKTVTVTVPSDGALVYYCRFHQARGMQGAFYLKDGDKVSTSGSGGAGSTSTSTSTGSGY
jgi:plastocyanin